MPEPEKKLTADEAGEAIKKAFQKLGLFSKLMEQAPAILEILQTDEPVVLEMLGSELVVIPWSAAV